MDCRRNSKQTAGCTDKEVIAGSTMVLQKPDRVFTQQ